MIRRIYLLAACFLLVSELFAQNNGISGKVRSQQNEPVEYATIVLQTADSTYVNALVTGETGEFQFSENLPAYRLVIQHVSYLTKEVVLNSPDAGVIILDVSDHELDQLVVTAERPLVKVVNGTLSYDVEQLTVNKPVTSAYDALLALPGVREQDDKITLIGTSGSTILLNGRPTTMSQEQLIQLLKQMPASYIETAEVMYSAPPQYHIRGAAINLVIRHMQEEGEEPVLQGEINGSYLQRRYDSYVAGASLLYSSNKLSADFMYSFSNYDTYDTMDLFSKHTVRDSVYNIEQHNKGRGLAQQHTMRLGLDYRPDDENTISAVYNGYLKPKGKSTQYSKGNFSESENMLTQKTQMHNISLDYTSGFGLKAGVNYTIYISPNQQRFINTDNSGSVTQFISYSEQSINTFMAYADQSHKLKKDWILSYGGKFNYAKDYSYQIYRVEEGGENLYDTRSTTQEYIADVYLGIAKNFSQQLSLNVSLTGEYYRFEEDIQWALFPQAQITYMPSMQNIFQFSLSSDKSYPGYWAKQDYIAYYNGYAEVHGNPALKPSDIYSSQLSYIMKQKYIFTLYYSYMNKYAQQLAYQSPDRPAIIYKVQNWDFDQRMGLNIIVPFKVGGWLDSRVTLNGFYQQAKSSQFHDISFDNRKWIGYAALDNTFLVSSKPDIKIELSGYYMSSPIQGIFDLSSVYSVNAGVKWTFARQKAELRLKATDIFDTSLPNIFSLQYGQNIRMYINQDMRRIQLSFSYKFGGYQEKERKGVDRSRFGQ